MASVQQVEEDMSEEEEESESVTDGEEEELIKKTTVSEMAPWVSTTPPMKPITRDRSEARSITNALKLVTHWLIIKESGGPQATTQLDEICPNHLTPLPDFGPNLSVTMKNLPLIV